MTAGERNHKSTSGKKRLEAMEFLRDRLASGQVEHTVIKQLAEDAGISSATLNRAKRQCGITSKRISGDMSVWKIE